MSMIMFIEIRYRYFDPRYSGSQREFQLFAEVIQNTGSPQMLWSPIIFGQSNIIIKVIIFHRKCTEPHSQFILVFLLADEYIVQCSILRQVIVEHIQQTVYPFIVTSLSG